MKRLTEWCTATPERRLTLGLLFFMTILWVPLAGCYGMWDPWETHYGEVARQMLERNDFVSLWWPGSPQDRAEFWSKPVLTFWLMAISMKLAGLEWSGGSPAEMASSWRVEWACRIPFILLSMAAVYYVYKLVRRLAGGRAAALTAVVLATSSQWVLVTRQAMTDIPFVAPMTIALALAGLGLLLPEEEREMELPRGRRPLLGGRIVFSWPKAPAFYGFVILFALTVLPQLLTFSLQVHLVLRLTNMNIRMPGVLPMLPYIGAFLLGLWWCGRARNKRQLYLFSGYVLCGLASLAKGPAGLVLPAIVLVLYLLLAGRVGEIFAKLEIPRGSLLFIAVAFPWYHAMLIRHGMGFWNEFIGDNYVHRAAGRHGDRGVFDYYLQWIGYGTFPWTGVAALGSLLSFRWLEKRDPRRGLVGFALVWLLVNLTTMSLVQTKFHHYILPALPAVAILAGLFLDELLTRPRRAHVVGLVLLATPLTLLAGRDLAAFPPRLLWLFNYDYVNMPGTGRPWPLPSLYGNRYEYGAQIWVFAAAAAAATLALAVWAAVARRAGAGAAEEGATQTAEPASGPVASGVALAVGIGFVVALVLGFIVGPATPGGAAPDIERTAWLLPAAIMLPFLGLVAALSWRMPRVSAGRAAPWALALVAVVWTAFIADKLLVELSPHWAQKHVVAAYFRNRKGPEEPLIAWQLYWRGENFYSKNIIFNSTDPAQRTVFLGDHNVEKLQTYLNQHVGKRVFFVVERVRYEGLRGLLPAQARPTLQIVDQSNNKLYLASAQL